VEPAGKVNLHGLRALRLRASAKKLAENKAQAAEPATSASEPPAADLPVKGKETPPVTVLAPEAAPVEEPATAAKVVPVKATTMAGTELTVLAVVPHHPDIVRVRVQLDGGPMDMELLLAELDMNDELHDWCRVNGAHLPPSRFKFTADMDRDGITYDQAVEVQQQQLDLLEFVLPPKLHLKLTRWCNKQNKPCTVAGPGVLESMIRGRHHVPRGLEVYMWLLQAGEFFKDMG
jgi:hypothetical protein